MPTTPPKNGRFNRSALVAILVGRVGKSAPSREAGTLARTSSGGATAVQAGSQYPQNPVPGAYSYSPPKRNEWVPCCQLSESVKPNLRRSRPCVAFEVFPTVTFVPFTATSGRFKPMHPGQSDSVGNKFRFCQY